MIQPRAHLAAIFRTKDETESRAPYLRLDKNERLIPIAPAVYNRFQQLFTLETAMAYPELEPLYQKLAQFLQADRSEIYLAAGSDIGIKSVYETFINPGDRVILHNPSYAMQSVYSKIFQADPITISCNAQKDIDTDAYQKALVPGIRMAVLENPNGYTGRILPLDQIEKLVRQAHENNTLFLIDEAYYLFSGQSLQSLYRRYDNVILSRTFSKDLGQAGLRCAYLLSQSQNIDSIYHVKPMHEINSAAAAFVMASLEFPQHIESYIQAVRTERAFLKEALEKQGILVCTGEGSFILIDCGSNTDIPKLVEEMKSLTFLVRRPPGCEHLKTWIRVSIGTREQSQKFLNVFPALLQKLGQRL